MSLVGPRPLMPASFQRYPEPIRQYLFNIKPGITGIGSILFRDEEQLITEVVKKGMAPLDYYKNNLSGTINLLEVMKCCLLNLIVSSYSVH